MNKIPKKILIASNNQGKIREISSMLSEIGVEAIGAKDLKEFENFEEPEENGETFEENSLIKAKFYAEKSGLVSLADDSGFCVEDLENRPSIHSARFALNEKGEKDFALAFQKIFDELKQKNISLSDKPKAHFICNLTIFDPKTGFHKSFEGRVEGFIVEPRGDKGFGYDPIFVKEKMEKTFGEIEAKEKDKISHRGDAFDKFMNFMRK